MRKLLILFSVLCLSGAGFAQDAPASQPMPAELKTLLATKIADAEREADALVRYLNNLNDPKADVLSLQAVIMKNMVSTMYEKEYAAEVFEVYNKNVEYWNGLVRGENYKDLFCVALQRRTDAVWTSLKMIVDEINSYYTALSAMIEQNAKIMADWDAKKKEQRLVLEDFVSSVRSGFYYVEKILPADSALSAQADAFKKGVSGLWNITAQSDQKEFDKYFSPYVTSSRLLFTEENVNKIIAGKQENQDILNDFLNLYVEKEEALFDAYSSGE